MAIGSLLLPLFLMAIDVINISAAWILALLLRFDGTIPQQYMSALLFKLPFFIVVGIVLGLIFRLYTRIWRYAGSIEVVATIGAIFFSTVAWYGISTVYGHLLPRTCYIIAMIFTLAFVAATRLAIRLYFYLVNRPGGLLNKFQRLRNAKRCLIVGAGNSGAELVRDIGRYHGDKYNIVGYIDDDKKKIGSLMYGKKVLGDRLDIAEMVHRYDVQEIMVAMPSAPANELKEIVGICKGTRCKVHIVPSLYSLLEGRVTINALRELQIEDLLGRDVVELEDEGVSEFIKDKVVLVTGAGGSIGSEICRQIARMQPKKLLLLGKGENSIYEIMNDLNSKFPDLKKVPIIADVRDRERIAGIMDHFHPQVVFHAAAHKHVPLMEYQPMEAVRNNILGTKVVAEEAVAHDVEKFVMISTDKAVNPTSVMGCTKRVAEMIVQSMNGVGKTMFVAVRFGNVLGSRGSVIPLFKKQIAKGGPVTVTHPDMKRYFMTIPEASQLVLQAGAMAEGGEVFVLDMGEPVKISDLATNMIELSGLEVGKDIEIKYTGLRPGEKLFEELLSAEDGTEPTRMPKIFMARIKKVTKADMDAHVEALLSYTDEDEVVATLQKVVPTYKPNRG